MILRFHQEDISIDEEYVEKDRVGIATKVLKNKFMIAY